LGGLLIVRELLLLSFACALLGACGSRSTAPQSGSASPGVMAVKPATPSGHGVRAFVDLPESDRSDALNERLHFCVFEDGDDDWIYVGVKYGLWSSGEFDLRVGDRLVFTGHVDHLLYGGTVLRMGDTIQGQQDNSSLRITRVTGMLK
jgi:hypothetical protein